DCGTVDRLDTEAIVTEFFTIVFPIWPARTVYLYNSADGEPRRVPIPLDRRSVALGYARFLTWMAALAFAAPGIFDYPRFAYLLPIGVVLAAMASVLTFAVGRLAPAEADRRALLRRVAGIGAPPELLPTPFRFEMCEQLADRWYTEHRLGWREAIDRGLGHELLIALAEYHCEPLLVMTARRNLAADLRWN
ncbi:MAG TPA: hypothetical protein VK427_15845, partial [Kofleriaceae bacterium]|nr:hypothetical protein [Kofleriaceae bacterium]